ncbi:hypothetical protein BJF85_15560 [Saccharomonospora sp. CUA-673]|uniref:hypothetical protein n=1 Tax=Saccharomonospora sp. CUA-673 TaxID=1904969 RepID=UPI00095E1F7B|nr:hypothetical protein [Saccharomonospora sp. CUA-673]OLT47580.1 hypothetical protein BJF85_15560 [Saccharomonospora sp. CUA-673]
MWPGVNGSTRWNGGWTISHTPSGPVGIAAAGIGISTGGVVADIVLGAVLLIVLLLVVRSLRNRLHRRAGNG